MCEVVKRVPSPRCLAFHIISPFLYVSLWFIVTPITRFFPGKTVGQMLPVPVVKIFSCCVAETRALGVAKDMAAP